MSSHETSDDSPVEQDTDLPEATPASSSRGHLQIGVSIAAVTILGVGALIFLASTLRRQESTSEKEQAEFRHQMSQAIAQLQQRLDQLQPSAASRESEAVSLGVGSAPSTERVVDEYQQRRQARQAILKGRREAFEEHVKQLSVEVAAWDAKFTALLTSEEGRKVAAQRSVVEKLLIISEQERPTPTTLSEFNARFDLVTAGSIEAVPSQAAPSTNWLSDLDALEKQVREAQTLVRSERLFVDSLQAEVAAVEPATISLQQALDALRAEKVAEQVADLKRARDAAESEAAKRVAAAETEAIRIKADTTVRAKEAEARDYVTKVAEQAQREKLRQRARGPDVRRMLAALLENGYTQPISTGNMIYFEKTADNGPISYSRIKTLGGLDAGLDGLRKLNWIAKYNDRPSKWAYGEHESTWPADAIPFIKSAQSMLIELGPTLVEEKLLAP